MLSAALIAVAVSLVSLLAPQPGTPEHALELQAFEQWQASQKPRALQAYERYLAQRLTDPPSLMELTITRHEVRPSCSSPSFSLPPRWQWPHILGPLRVVARMQQDNILSGWRFSSVHRDRRSNRCVVGARHSRHLYNAAIDLQLTTTSEVERAATIERLCQFWRTEGRRLRLGFGVYRDGQFHIDVRGYRTWGASLHRSSSPCAPAKAAKPVKAQKHRRVKAKR